MVVGASQRPGLGKGLCVGMGPKLPFPCVVLSSQGTVLPQPAGLSWAPGPVWLGPAAGVGLCSLFGGDVEREVC